MDLPPETEYIRERIETSLGLQISVKDMQLKLIASEDARHHLQDQVFHLEHRLREATRQIEQYKARLHLRPLMPMKYSRESKRPPSSFFIFMKEFEKSFKEMNPNNRSIAVVGKAGGEKWKSLSEAEKAPFVAKANKLKSEYNNKMNAYNKKQAEPRKKSSSEVHYDDEDFEDDELLEEDDYFE